MTLIENNFMEAELALAAYAKNLVAGIPNTDELTKSSVGMSPAQAKDFAEQWRVVTQYDDPSGLSATIFQKTTGGQKYLAIRGTEATGSDLATDGILALGIPSALNPQFAALKTKLDTDWLKAGGLLDGQNFTVTGHSLGGYLAAAVKQQYGAHVTDAYLFNAPGVGGPLGNLADALTGALGLSGTPGGNIWNVRGSEGFPFISGLGSQLGTRIDIQTEAAANPLNNHSIVTLTDALAIQSAYAQLAPSLTQSDLNALIDASGNPMALTLESALDALRTLFTGAAVTPTPDDRDSFYTNLYALQGSSAYTSLVGNAQITVLADETQHGLVSLAKQSGDQGMAARYALQALNPFALSGVNYATLNADGALDLFDADAHPNGMTTQYLYDRASFLQRKLWFDTQDKNPNNSFMTTDLATNQFEAESKDFEDTASHYKINQGGIYDNTPRYLFGDANANTLTGGPVEDHLYGGAGDMTDARNAVANPEWRIAA